MNVEEAHIHSLFFPSPFSSLLLPLHSFIPKIKEKLRGISMNLGQVGGLIPLAPL